MTADNVADVFIDLGHTRTLQQTLQEYLGVL